ncbi:Solute carrier family 25 member 35 [Eumeta japonica]|uniref:Solute carrier family 25 member 35 n=1 Tax=Eumeta variegata TaxID=151549 RepID=A0A4C1SVS1_EUMVA|nr:Solute carrier family 25 member 35 [Eumeta japonica]
MDASDFVLGGLASVGATFFTNPIEVIKTPYNIQGELAARGTYVEPYRGIFNAFVTVAKNDGLAGLQKGQDATPSHKPLSKSLLAISINIMA